jgi:hypothetical protein
VRNHLRSAFNHLEIDGAIFAPATSFNKFHTLFKINML